MGDKPVVWLGSSREDIRQFSREVRGIAGTELQSVQRGKDPKGFKPMPTVGSGVYEIRIRTGVEHRVFYVAKFDEAVYVLHAFQKKTQKTAQHDLEIGRRRYQTLQQQRQATLQRGRH
jgi:phage-related protein